MAERKFRRITVGEGDQQWSFLDPRNDVVMREWHAMRAERRMALPSLVSDYWALLMFGTNEDACRKLRAIRNWLKEQREDEDEPAEPGTGAG